MLLPYSYFNCTRIHSSQKASGFTLLEVLIAVAIFSIISLSSFTLFNTVLNGDEISKARTTRNNELQRAFLFLERDITQIARRSIRLNGEKPIESYLLTTNDSFQVNEQALSFVRHGWTNPGLLLPRSDMQAVAYRVVDETLERLHFNFVDAVVGEEPRVRPLLNNVNTVLFEFYDGRKWQESWSGKTLPQAIAIEVDTIDFGLIRRQFLVPGNEASENESTSGNTNGT